MKYSKMFGALFALVCFAATDFGILNAQETKKAEAATTTTSTRKVIGFRCVNWQHKHIHDMDAAAKLIESLEKIGCEVTKHDHNGHLDVKFRCPNWKSITVENDEFQKQWNSWLIGNGMETVMLNPASTDGLEIVKLRKAEWHKVHLHDAKQAAQMVSMLKLVGCEANQHEHDGHIDVSYRAPTWTTIALHSHDAAHSWQGWLNGMGFETEHSH